MAENESVERRADRLSDLGARIARIAHELNAPVSLIVGSIESLDRQLEVLARYAKAAESAGFIPPGAEPSLASGAAYAAQNAPRLMQVCEEGVRRLRHVTDQLRAYAGGVQVSSRREPFALAAVIRRAARMAEVGRDTLPLVEIDLESGLVGLGDSNVIDQIATNVIGNAFDAVAGRPNPRVLISARADPSGGCIEIRVRDNGPGVPAAFRRAIFEPFFTTKSGGRGLGLGLAIAKEAIEGQGGRLEVVDAPAPGAEFLLCIPGTGAQHHA